MGLISLVYHTLGDSGPEWKLTSQKADNGFEHSNNSVDDGHDNTGNGIDDSHDASTNGLETGDDGTHVCGVVIGEISV